MQGNQQTQLKYLFLGIVIIGLFQEISYLRTPTATISTPTPKSSTPHHHHHHQPQTNQQYNTYTQPSSNKRSDTKSNTQTDTSTTNNNRKYSSSVQSNLHLSVLYCTSCSYSSSFQSLKQSLLLQYPLLTVTGSQYPLPPLSKLISKVLSYTQYGLIAIGIFGDRVQFLAQNALYQRMRQNKMMVLMGGYLGINFLQGMVGSSGAFEVYLEGEEVFSKLRMGRMPEKGEVEGIVERKVGKE